MQILHKKDIVRQYACLTVPFMQYQESHAKISCGKDEYGEKREVN